MSKKIKADMNFLEYPTNVVDFKSKDNKIYELKISDDKYYKLVSRADDRLPSSKDKIVFYYFLHELKKSGFKNNIVTISRYKTSKEIWGVVGKCYYTRIETALSRYKGVTAEFHGCFFSDGKYSTVEFGFIDNWGIIKETGKLEIKFNDYFIEQMKKTHFYRNIDFDEIKNLKSDIALRLYEYLLKLRLPFKIGIIKLGEKLTLAKTALYPSLINPLLRRSLKEINKKTSLKIDFNYNKDRKIITFFPAKPTSQIIQNPEENSFNLSDDTPTKEILKTLSKKEFTTLETRAKNSLRTQGWYFTDSPRSKDIIKEEMVKLFVEDKEDILVAQDRLNDPKAEYIDFDDLKKELNLE